MKNKIQLLCAANILFITYFLISLLPDAGNEQYHFLLLTGLMIAVEAFFLIWSFADRDAERVSNIGKNVAVVYFVVDVWLLLSQKTGVINTHLFPAPGLVLDQFFSDFGGLIAATGNSLRTIFTGFILAVAAAVPLGLVLGWYKQVRSPANFVVRFLSAIPPIVFIPYAVALLPSFRAASIFVIFIAAYWPTMSGTMHGVVSIDKRILDSARALNVGTKDMLLRIILPASLPHIFSGANTGLAFAFILLTSAEMIGADTEHPGLGYYIQNYSNFGNFKRVILGIIFIGIVICLISVGFRKIQNYLLRWRAE